MFDDPGKELRRLEQELLDEEEDRLAHAFAQEDTEDEESGGAVPGSSRGVRSRNTDSADVDLDAYSDEIHDAPKKGAKGIVIAIGLGLLGIAALAVYRLVFAR